MDKRLLRENKLVNQKFSSQQIKFFDIVFIGGGPSTLAFFSYLFSQNLIDKIMHSCNVLIIEKNENFGSGCLGKFQINSNTSAEGFTKLICNVLEKKNLKNKSEKLSLDEKGTKYSTNNLPTKSKSDKHYNELTTESKIKSEISNTTIKTKVPYEPIYLFKEVFYSSIVQTLLSYGNQPAPLKLVADYLDTLGNFIVYYLTSQYGVHILSNKTEVKSVKISHLEDFMIDAKDDRHENSSIIKADCIVFSTGGKQSITNHLYRKIVKIMGEENTFMSDYVLQAEGYRLITTRLNCINKQAAFPLKTNSKQIDDDKKKIVTIIGGSHSGFSCAWLLLNGPVDNNITTEYASKQTLNCTKCKMKYKKQASGYNLNIRNECICICNDKVNWRNKKISQFKANNVLTDIDLEIHILYRGDIKVYFSSREEAEKEEYYQYDESCVNKSGKIYPFVGLRGDAKNLYNKIRTGEEKRVKLIRIEAEESQLENIKQVSCVIWACGYESKKVPFFDSQNDKIEFLADHNGTIEVDKELSVMNVNKSPVKNLFGIGQGYSTKTPEIINGKKQRADSIHIYSSHIASKLYRSLDKLIDKYITDSQKSKADPEKCVYNSSSINNKASLSKSNCVANEDSQYKINIKNLKKDSILAKAGKHVLNTKLIVNNENILMENLNKKFKENFKKQGGYLSSFKDNNSLSNQNMPLTKTIFKDNYLEKVIDEKYRKQIEFDCSSNITNSKNANYHTEKMPKENSRVNKNRIENSPRKYAPSFIKKLNPIQHIFLSNKIKN